MDFLKEQQNIKYLGINHKKWRCVFYNILLSLGIIYKNVNVKTIIFIYRKPLY
jgi:hypothetical protein